MDCSLPGSSVHGILQARILEWVAIPFSRGSSRPRDWTQVSCTVGRFFTIWATRKSNINILTTYYISSVQFSRSVISNSLQTHGLQHTRLPCPSPNLGACSNPYPSSWWCHPAISSSVIPFSSCLQSFPASGSLPMSQFFTSSDQSIGVSDWASVLPTNTQDWLPLGWTGCISFQSKGLSRVVSNTRVQKHQFFSTQLFLCNIGWAKLKLWCSIG